jgi:hypothetical protein
VKEMKCANLASVNRHYACATKEEEEQQQQQQQQQHNLLHRYHLKLQPPPLHASLTTNSIVHFVISAGATVTSKRRS